ncbi:hypothetical protein EMEDMD4_270097 [Sinorhizobium medicae]|uniref:Uncharacterized protein n=1 Tax=Sinorhizobium medicae TaxID=110321 RepID=A0A508X0J0_9HYPH|nr:hypothetical protein EMEDMD4_270097 [Sinorhizobium medicae]
MAQQHYTKPCGPERIIDSGFERCKTYVAREVSLSPKQNSGETDPGK